MLAQILLLLAALAPQPSSAQGRPLFYWGARPPVIETGTEPGRGLEAQVMEVHAALDEGSLVLRLSFDRPVREATYLPSGAPVSGRLQAVLYLDADNHRSTGFEAGPRDLRTGADYRIEVGVLALGANEEDNLPAQALIVGFAAALGADGRRRSLWRGDESGTPGNVSARGEWVELRLPAGLIELANGARLILSAMNQAWDGRLVP